MKGRTWTEPILNHVQLFGLSLFINIKDLWLRLKCQRLIRRRSLTNHSVPFIHSLYFALYSSVYNIQVINHTNAIYDIKLPQIEFKLKTSPAGLSQAAILVQRAAYSQKPLITWWFHNKRTSIILLLSIDLVCACCKCCAAISIISTCKLFIQKE